MAELQCFKIVLIPQSNVESDPQKCPMQSYLKLRLENVFQSVLLIFALARVGGFSDFCSVPPSGQQSLCASLALICIRPFSSQFTQSLTEHSSQACFGGLSAALVICFGYSYLLCVMVQSSFVHSMPTFLHSSVQNCLTVNLTSENFAEIS